MGLGLNNRDWLGKFGRRLRRELRRRHQFGFRRGLDFQMRRTRRERFAQTPLNQNSNENETRAAAGCDNQNYCDLERSHRLGRPEK